MGLTLLSATPSPYARKVRIALHEKDIPFELKNEVPWDSTTETPKWNPLEQLPVLILDNGSAVYDSSHILEYISLKYKSGDGAVDVLLPEDIDERLKAKQIDVLATGMMDAVGRKFFEAGRGDKASPKWTARQERKIEGGLNALQKLAKDSAGNEFLVGGKLTVADLAGKAPVLHHRILMKMKADSCVLAAGSALGMLDMVQIPWQDGRPELTEYYGKLEQRDSFQKTKPFMFEMKDEVV